ncbi:BTB domain-containing protein [Mycena sanguinolenta]|uniref:BTB domain-containing protein n=1 Tax=Mycena sanguinolenta TaxID=230812 RepID=A0A8H6ZFX4_9AGAR|nr:BTB domain-containing protein [Mycena sanguinolenta]
MAASGAHTLSLTIIPTILMASPQSPDAVRPSDIQRDKDHYHAEGDSIIRVEQTLFKVHKAFLTHNSSVFSTMFNLPVGMGDPEGSSDDNPIVLLGDEVEDFCAVLNYIYAPPVRTQIQDITTAALPEIISVVKFAHKYAMDHWKEWGLKVLVRLLDDISSVPAEHLCALYSLYHLVGDAPLGDRVIQRWCTVIEEGKFPIVSILDAASACQDQDTLAQAYCIQIGRWENGGKSCNHVRSKTTPRGWPYPSSRSAHPLRLCILIYFVEPMAQSRTPVSSISGCFV